MSYSEIFNYGTMATNVNTYVLIFGPDCNFCLFTKRNKIIQKMKWFMLIEKDYLLAIRSKGLHFCDMELGSDRIVQIIFGLRPNF